MDFWWEGFREALRLLVSGDREVMHAAFVSVLVTTTAIALTVVG